MGQHCSPGSKKTQMGNRACLAAQPGCCALSLGSAGPRAQEEASEATKQGCPAAPT